MLDLNLRSMISVTIYCTQKERPTQIHTADFKGFAKISIVSPLCFTQMTRQKIHSVTASLSYSKAPNQKVEQPFGACALVADSLVECTVRSCRGQAIPSPAK